jgi:hypothetical protein
MQDLPTLCLRVSWPALCARMLGRVEAAVSAVSAACRIRMQRVRGMRKVVKMTVQLLP